MFPARAGMNRYFYPLLGYNKHVPRTRGDEPDYELDVSVIDVCSPHARG